MHGLEILHTKTLEILLRGLDTRMAQNSRQVEKISTSPKVSHGKRMPQRMEGAANTYDAQFFTTDFEITPEIWLGELTAVASAKDDGVFMQC
jgi:hypothetical protein